MDSFTQIALGAAVGELVLGRRVGYRAVLWGAVCGGLPDLDVLVPMDDPVAAFTYHRSWSHSLFVLAFATPVMLAIIRWLHPAHARHRLGWTALIYGVFATHVLLDCFTIYGTQIFWPLDTTPMTWGSLFIIDPAYTLPLLIGLLAVLVLRKRPERAWRINAAMLALTTLYIGWSMAAKYHVQDRAERALAEQSLGYERIVTLASPFNTLLWRVVAMDGNGYLVGWYSILSPDASIRFTHYPSQENLLDGLEDHWPVARLRWFTKGFYRVRQVEDEVVITDLRMGIEGAYAFGFKVAVTGPDGSQATPAEARSARPELGRLNDLWDRLLGRHRPAP